MVYIICFILTPLFTYLAEKQFEKGNKKLGILWSFLAIFIPSLIAGLRAFDVGRDIGNYVTPAIDSATSLSFIDYMNSLYVETGYKIFVYLMTFVSSSTNFVLFMMQFVTILFVYLFAYKSRNKINMTLVITVYMLTWYCMSFTYMRQSIAVAIILYSLTFFIDKKYFKTLLLFLLALSFHKTAIVSLLIYGFVWLTNLNIQPKKKNLIYILIFVIMALSTIFYEQIIYFFTNVISILPSKYYEYTQSYFATEESKSLTEHIYKVFWIIAACFYKKFANKEESKICIDFVLFLLFTDFLILLISDQISNVSRISLYFFQLGLFYLIPNIGKAFKNYKSNRNIITGICVVIMFAYWCLLFPVYNWCETFPYHSDIIKFLQ